MCVCVIVCVCNAYVCYVFAMYWQYLQYIHMEIAKPSLHLIVVRPNFGNATACEVRVASICEIAHNKPCVYVRPAL